MSASHYDPRITAYFGDTIMQAGFMPLPHLFLRHYRRLGLSQIQAMFVLQLMEIAWDFGDAPSTVTKLAKRMGVTTRSIQLCSQEVQALGLVEIYDQFDQSGAQVENGYDLSPLFQQLSALAPVTVPAGQLRTRRSRTERSAVASNSDNLTIAPPKKRSSAPVKDSSLIPGKRDQPPPLDVFIQPLHMDSRLKTELKNQPKKQSRTDQQQLPAAEGQDTALREPQLHQIDRQPGHSLRWDIPISSAEIAQSRQVLDRAGLNANVVAAVAPTLHPAECWALRSYARGARLGPAWIASQVYDFSGKCPQPAYQSSSYDASARLLATLPLSLAETLLDITDKYCPQMPDALLSTPGCPLLDPAQRQAFDLLWSAMHEQRIAAPRAGVSHHRVQKVEPSVMRSAPEVEDPCWAAVRARLAQELAPEEYAAWLAPTTLLDINDGRFILGTPNVFARDQVMDVYQRRIAAALSTELGRTVSVEVVINAPLCA
ncbi:MAG: hypothetical protein NVS4B8_24470 [Herpetosiphon sp.]